MGGSQSASQGYIKANYGFDLAFKKTFMEKNNMQLLFFQQIKELLPPHLAGADEIARVLNVSRDSAYRRMRGEKILRVGSIAIRNWKC